MSGLGACLELSRERTSAVGDRLFERREAALLRGSQIFRDDEALPVVERGADRAQPRLELARARRDVAPRRVRRPEQLVRTLEEQPSIRVPRREQRVEQRERFAVREGVPGDRVERAILVGVRMPRERDRERRTDRAARDLSLRTRREPSADQDAPLDPARSSAEHLRDPRRRAPVVVDQRADHARLVERRQRARRPICAQHRALVIRDPVERLDDDGHRRHARLTPRREALEAVDDLVATERRRRDADGERSAEFQRRRPRTRTKSPIARVERVDGYERDVLGHR